MSFRMLFFMTLLPAASAAAQAPASAAPPDGSTRYASAFGDYRPYREPPPQSWRAVNEEVAALEGHMGHLRGHGGGRTAPGAAASPAAKPGGAK